VKIHKLEVFDRGEIVGNTIRRFRRAEQLCEGGETSGAGSHDWSRVTCKDCLALRAKWEGVEDDEEEMAN
jgi:hypothetical protein